MRWRIRWDESLSALLSLEEDFLDKNLLTPFPCSLWSALYSSCWSHSLQQSPSAVLPLCWVLLLPLQVSKGDPKEKASPSPQTGQNWTFSEGTMPDCGEMWMNSPKNPSLKHIYLAELICCSPKTITTLLTGCISAKELMLLNCGARKGS